MGREQGEAREKQVVSVVCRGRGPGSSEGGEWENEGGGV